MHAVPPLPHTRNLRLQTRRTSCMCCFYAFDRTRQITLPRRYFPLDILQPLSFFHRQQRSVRFVPFRIVPWRRSISCRTTEIRSFFSSRSARKVHASRESLPRCVLTFWSASSFLRETAWFWYDCWRIPSLTHLLQYSLVLCCSQTLHSMRRQR